MSKFKKSKDRKNPKTKTFKKDKKPKETPLSDMGDKYPGLSSPVDYSYGEDYYSFYSSGESHSYRGYQPKQIGHSASAQWSKRFGGWGFSSSNEKEKFRKIKNTIARSANLIRNKEAGDENELRISWSKGGDVNKIDDNIVFLSPDVLDKSTTKKPSWKDDELTDVLIGQALMDSTMKRTASLAAQEKIKSQQIDEIPDKPVFKGDPDCDCSDCISERKDFEDRLKEHINEFPALKEKIRRQKTQRDFSEYLWYTCESIVSRNEVIREYPGFADYFSAHRDYYTDKDCRANLEKELLEDPTPALALKSLAYNLLRLDDQIEVPEKYEGVVNEALEELIHAETSQQRAEAAIHHVSKFIEKFYKENDEEDGDDNSDDPGDGRDLVSGIGINSEIGSQEVENQSAFAEEGEDEDSYLEDMFELKEEDGKVPEDLLKCFKVEETARSRSRYIKMQTELRPHILALRNRLKLHKEQYKMFDRGLKSGQIDEGSLHKINFHRHGFIDRSLFEREEILNKPKVVVALLVDESSSMSGHIGGESSPRRYELAQQAAIILANAVEGLEGVDYCVRGHAAEGHSPHGEFDRVGIHDYYTPENLSISQLSNLGEDMYACNADGFAIQDTVRNLEKWYPNSPKKLLIHISDGLPNADGYRGDSAVSHVKKVCQESRSRYNTEVFGICIGDFSKKQATEMYGTGRWAILTRTAALPLAAGNLITKYLAKTLLNR